MSGPLVSIWHPWVTMCHTLHICYPLADQGLFSKQKKTVKKKRAASPTGRKDETKGWAPWYGPIYWSSSWRVNCLQDLCRISLGKTKSNERDRTWSKGRECPWRTGTDKGLWTHCSLHSLFPCATLGEMVEEHGWVSRCSSPLAIGNKLHRCPDAKPFLPMTVIGEWSVFISTREL